MKKIVGGSLLQFPLSFIVFCLLITQVSIAQDCKTQAANKPSTLVRSQDNYFDFSFYTYKPAKWNNTKMKLQLDKAESWIKNRLTGFTGAKLDYSNTYWLDFVVSEEEDTYAEKFYKATGTKGYYDGKMRFFAYYCYDNNYPIETEGESGSFVQVVFNNVLASELVIPGNILRKLNGNYVFEILEKDRTEGRIDFYDLRKRMDFSDTIYTSKTEIIIIRNSDKPVFIPITRKEYLQQMLQDIETYKAKSIDFKNSFYKSRLKSFEEEMRSYKTMDKSYTPEKEAKRRKWFNEDVNPEKLAKDLKKLEDEVNGANQIITEYLDKPQEWLSRGVSSFYNWSTYDPRGVKEYFDNLDVYRESKEDYRRAELVYINPAYFDKSLSRDIPQLILVELSKNGYPHMEKVAALVKQPGALAPLEAMFNKSN